MDVKVTVNGLRLNPQERAILLIIKGLLFDYAQVINSHNNSDTVYLIEIDETVVRKHPSPISRICFTVNTKNGKQHLPHDLVRNIQYVIDNVIMGNSQVNVYNDSLQSVSFERFNLKQEQVTILTKEPYIQP